MIIVMKGTSTPEQVNHVKEMIREMGLTDHPIQGSELTVVAVIGDDRKKDRNVFENAPGVDRVVPILAPYKLSAIETKPERSAVRISDECVIGGTHVPVIAGPCSVESQEQILASARAVRASGGHALRGGAFKPRTNPYSFQGHGVDGLKMLAAARDETGLAIVTEVLSVEDVDVVSEYADCLQIGTRNAANYKLLEAAGKQPKPVLLKRGMAMTIDELLQAAEYILSAGNQNVVLCERGVRTFEDHTRNTLSLSAIPELHHRSHLPIVSDPSHGTGHARLVADMARASVAAGCDALAIEMHPDPEHAWTDGAQSITPQALNELIKSCKRVAEAVDRSM